MTSRDIDKLIAMLRRDHSGLFVKQLKVIHPADDDGIWFFRTAEGTEPEVQVESWNGQLPFLIEGDIEGQCAEVSTLESAAETVCRWLEIPSKAAE